MAWATVPSSLGPVAGTAVNGGGQAPRWSESTIFVRSWMSPRAVSTSIP
ncbi:hypothetical protein FMEAI12_5680011 [Parafrankia sp. Ea1.12]|nr:hypothetical protein FMEAI12_5680011 [Parafrankia sp. Ea1.12]